MPGDSGVPVVTNSCVFYYTRGCGCIDTRHSPRPLISEGGTFLADLARNMRRDREAVFDLIARSDLSAVAQRAKAEATKQSILSLRGDNGLLRGACHRARIRATRWLAMTVSELAV